MKLRPAVLVVIAALGVLAWAYGTCLRPRCADPSQRHRSDGRAAAAAGAVAPGPNASGSADGARAGPDRYDAALAPRTHADVAHDDELVVRAGADPELARLAGDGDGSVGDQRSDWRHRRRGGGSTAGTAGGAVGSASGSAEPRTGAAAGGVPGGFFAGGSGASAAPMPSRASRSSPASRAETHRARSGRSARAGSSSASSPTSAAGSRCPSCRSAPPVVAWARSRSTRAAAST